jgi:hypothetical protein
MLIIASKNSPVSRALSILIEVAVVSCSLGFCGLHKLLNLNSVLEILFFIKIEFKMVTFLLIFILFYRFFKQINNDLSFVKIIF